MIELLADLDADQVLSYTVVETTHGIYARALDRRGRPSERQAMPAEDCTALLRAWGERGYKVLVLGLPGALLAAARSVEHARRWREKVAERAEAAAAGDPELAWILGPDTGMSSIALFYWLVDSPNARAMVAKRLSGGDDQYVRQYETPSDADDFGRCSRLLDRFPHYRARLVLQGWPVGWAPLGRAWPELEDLYRKGHYGLLGDRLRDLE